MKDLHSLLKRQLKRHGIDLENVSDNVHRFIFAVNDAYHQSDIDRDMLERSLELSSQELLQANSELRAIFMTFPDMFFRLDKEGKVLDFKVGTSSVVHPPIGRMVGLTIDEMPIDEIREKLLAAIEEVKETDKLVSAQFKMRTRGKVNYFEARLLPLLETQIICIIRNITEAKAAELALIKSEQRYRTVLESSPNPIVVYDMKGTIEYANPAFSKVFGWSLDEIRYKNVRFVPDTVRDQTDLKIKLIKQGVDVHGFETQRYNRFGEMLDVIINASLRFNKEGKVIGSVVSFVNITERKKLEADLHYAMEQAESANRAKTEFLTNMSHELRTPMHAILGFAKLIIDNFERFKSNKILGFLNEIYEAGQRLMLLLDDLLDLSKLEVGRVDYDFQRQKLSDVVSLVIKELESVSTEKKIDIIYRPPDFEDWVKIDSNKIMQVVRNLISNAVKFSHENNNVIIRIIEQSGIVILSIKDFGVGIPNDELESVFDKFVQSSKTKTGAGGTGLGLAICREIINDHEGRIWVKNNIEGGVTLFVSLAAL